MRTQVKIFASVSVILTSHRCVKVYRLNSFVPQFGFSGAADLSVRCIIFFAKIMENSQTQNKNLANECDLSMLFRFVYRIVCAHAAVRLYWTGWQAGAHVLVCRPYRNSLAAHFNQLFLIFFYLFPH